MKQYLDLLQNILQNGTEKESGRANMPNTFGISKGEINMDLKDGFPLLTTKKMYLKGIVLELLWFLRGETNIKYLINNNVNIWNSDAYRWYNDTYVKKRGAPEVSMEEFIENVKNGVGIVSFSDNDNWGESYIYGDLGKVYGYQWRNQNGVDQVKEVLDGLKANPYSRYHVIDAWNKADFNEMALPPCHLLYQFIVRPLSLEERIKLANGNPEWVENEKLNNERGIPTEYEIMCNVHKIPKFYLDLNMYQRSCDTLLGVPFNIASMSLLLMLFAKASNMIAGVSTWIGGDTHIYVNHIEGAYEQLDRLPYPLPELKIKKELNSLDDILGLGIDDFELIDYQSHPTIKFELFTGNKK